MAASLNLKGLPDGALVLIDTAPIVRWLEGDPQQNLRLRPLFEAHDAGRVRFAVTASTLAEVLTGPLGAGDEALARRYRAVLETWRVVPFDAGIAETAARLRGALALPFPEALQAASALAINAAALVTEGEEFERVTGLRVIG
ncbi:MAG: type II toxin-antitoxin system VapC family toxin [Caulobacteraceae bacterium]